MMLFSWVAIKQVWASGKCDGGKYIDHPALQAECLHQQTVSSSNSGVYPAPDDGTEPRPYPEPIVIPAPLPMPKTMPTEPPAE